MNELQQSQLDEIIAAHPFLKGLEAQYLPLFFKAATYQRFGVDSLIFREACGADHFYLIHKGAVTLESFVPGRGMTTVQTIGAGDALGWSWLFPPYLWHFSARAVEPTELVALWRSIPAPAGK